jgi:chromosome segregation ATPase
MMSHATPMKPLLALGLLLVLAACDTNAPANQRGFFGGLGAMATGNDERRAQSLENSAAQAEASTALLRQRANVAAGQAAITSGQVQAAEQRLAALDRTLRDQRVRLNQMRAQANASPTSAAEANRLDQEAERIQRDARAAASQVGGATPAQTQQLEQRSRALQSAMDQLSRSM